MRARRSRLIAAAPLELWSVIADPHHFPRWWPGVVRVEGVGSERFTHVYTTRKGRTVRIDFRVRESHPPEGGVGGYRLWEQELAGTPFERVLSEVLTGVVLEPVGRRPAAQAGVRSQAGERTMVTITLEQRLRGYSRTGGWMLRRGANRRLEEALDGLERICPSS